MVGWVFKCLCPSELECANLPDLVDKTAILGLLQLNFETSVQWKVKAKLCSAIPGGFKEKSSFFENSFALILKKAVYMLNSSPSLCLEC